MKRKHLAFSVISAAFSACVVVFALWLPSKYQVPVLMYHAVAPVWYEALNNVKPEHFEKQMAFLKSHGYRVLTVQQLVDGVASHGIRGHKNVVITFDDGYENNYTAAYPLLKKYAFPAVIFVEVGHLGNPGRLSWPQAREMLASGISIESHVMTGAYLPALSAQERDREIFQSKNVLEERLGRPVHFIAYPIGGFNEDIKKSVRSAGYAAAFTTNRGYGRWAGDLYELKRIRVKDSDGDLQLWLKLSGYYNLIRDPRNPS